MSPEPFASRLADHVARRRSQVVLGLDPDPARLPGGAAGARDFCLRVIEQAAPYEDITVGRGPAFELRTEDLPGVAQTIDEDD